MNFPETAYRYNHKHICSQDSSQNTLEKILFGVHRVAEMYGISNFKITPYSENDRGGYLLSSDDFDSYSKLLLIFAGDAPNPGAFVHEHDLRGSKNFRDNWVRTAKKILSDNNIPFSFVTLEDNLYSGVYKFSFDQFSCNAFFVSLINHGAIDFEMGPNRPPSNNFDFRNWMPKPK